MREKRQGQGRVRVREGEAHQPTRRRVGGEGGEGRRGALRLSLLSHLAEPMQCQKKEGGGRLYKH